MAQKGRPGLSATQKTELWQRWKLGQSLSDIGRALSKHAGSIHTILSALGGIIPATRSRSTRSLSLQEREEISRGLAAGESIRQIAAELTRSPSTMKEYRKRNASGAVYDDPRIAVGPGVLTELERERKRSQNTRPSDTALSHYGSHGTQRSNAKLCAVADGGRIRAAEGINRHVVFRC
jgi:IS30 family transposase